ncbi:unnamed protein product [Trichogramma brassicae]|uniref:Uncharacterized protein n=1 Tax=Trichogramma brassicae TaxID=86971 RepID=A0A6H5IJ84_9HYME|nr:unnamed protein product [Trichogramma brassicae]
MIYDNYRANSDLWRRRREIRFPEKQLRTVGTLVKAAAHAHTLFSIDVARESSCAKSYTHTRGKKIIIKESVSICCSTSRSSSLNPTLARSSRSVRAYMILYAVVVHAERVLENCSGGACARLCSSVFLRMYTCITHSTEAKPCNLFNPEYRV